MQVLEGLLEPAERSVLTIGNFDGVHRGHRHLIARAQEEAARRGLPVRVVTFEPHPAVVLGRPAGRFLLTPGSLKWRFMERLGVASVSVLPFTAEFAQLDAESFLNDIVRDSLKAAHVVVGFNFSFGKGGLGNGELLRAWGESQNIPVTVVEPYVDPGTGTSISSSRIRTLVREGAMEQAAALLGHAYEVESAVAAGDQRGREIGAPTLNLRVPSDQVMGPYGVYAGWISVRGRRLGAVANWGVRPTFGGTEPSLEVHALEPLGFDHYGDLVRFEIGPYLRPEQRFESPEALGAQIRKDVEEAAKWLETSR